jgi:hypothetical protein
LVNIMTDWDQLLQSGPDRSLDRLEQDVRRAVGARRADDRRSVVLMSAQASLVVLSVCGSLVWGGVAASRASAAPASLGVFSPHMTLAPSSRLGEPTP